MPAAFYLYMDDVDGSYERALGAGAVSISGPADQPYWDGVARVTDPAGNIWYAATYVGGGVGQ